MFAYFIEFVGHRTNIVKLKRNETKVCVSSGSDEFDYSRKDS